MTGRPHIATIHDIMSVSDAGFWSKWSKQSGIQGLQGVFGRIIEILATHAYKTTVHTVSETSKRDILLYGTRNPVIVIPNGIDYSKYEERKTEARNQVTFIGRHVFYKNLDVVLEALPDVIRNIPDARLVAIGDGPMQGAWKEKSMNLGLGASVVFTGHIPDKAKLFHLSRSVALVLPSLVEGFGIVILEAYAMKKPVLVSDLPPMNQLVCDLKDGFLIDPKDPRGWADRITQIMKDRSLAEAMGRRGYQKLLNKYEIGKTTSKLENLYIQHVSPTRK